MAQKPLVITVQEIESMSRAELTALWPRFVETPVPRGISQPMLRRILAYEVQVRAGRGLSSAAKRQLATSVPRESSTRRRKLKPGGRLVREWMGVTHVIDVTDKGYVWRDKTFTSLTAIAGEITGSHTSGPRFFGLKKG